MKSIINAYDRFMLQIFIGYLFSFGLAVVMFITFIYAFFFNGYSVLVTINSFGEARVELMLVCSFMAFSILGLFKLVKGVKKIESETS